MNLHTGRSVERILLHTQNEKREVKFNTQGGDMLSKEECELGFLGSQDSAPSPEQECPWQHWDSTEAKISNN